jgi:hypothetical protein
VIIFDSTYLIAFLHPDPPPPMDGENHPVERFKERIEELVNTLNADDTLVGVPTPVVAEILVRYPENKIEYLEALRNRYRFDIVPFGIKAAIEASELIAKLVAETKQPGSQWQKVKFDIQIVSMAKAEEKLTMLYADDKGIVNNAIRLGIPVMRICDLPLPRKKMPPPEPIVEESGQEQLIFEAERYIDDENETAPIKEESVAPPSDVRERGSGGTGDKAGEEDSAKRIPEAETAIKDGDGVKSKVSEDEIGTTREGHPDKQGDSSEAEGLKTKPTSQGGLG